MNCIDPDDCVGKLDEEEIGYYAIRYECMAVKWFIDYLHVSRLDFLKDDLNKTGLEYSFSFEIFSDFEYERIPLYLHLKVDKDNILASKRKFEEIRNNCREIYDILYCSPVELSHSEAKEIFEK